MSNNYFQFKQFRVEQEIAAMKVTTDACLFGAWIAGLSLSPSTILDIGSGTGLLSLMLAQETDALIDAVEIDENSFHQTIQNFEQSKFAEQLKAHHLDISDYNMWKDYDLIISNPPFYQNELSSPLSSINVARHDDGLTLNVLAEQVDRLLGVSGCFAVLLPYQRVDEFEKIAASVDLHVYRKMLVRQTEEHSFFRGMLIFTREPKETIIEEIAIKIKGNYSEEFRGLLEGYYLNL